MVTHVSSLRNDVKLAEFERCGDVHFRLYLDDVSDPTPHSITLSTNSLSHATNSGIVRAE